MKSYTLEELLDKYIGKKGSPERDAYEHKLSMELLGRAIRTARRERKLTQQQLGDLVGVQKAQISKLENSCNSATIDTILKVFTALKAEVHFEITIGERKLSIT